MDKSGGEGFACRSYSRKEGNIYVTIATRGLPIALRSQSSSGRPPGLIHWGFLSNADDREVNPTFTSPRTTTQETRLS